MILLRLAWQSLNNRRAGVLLVLLSLALSVSLILGVERLRQQVRSSFTSTVSGVDLIVGARSGPLNLLLYSIFHLGEPTANIGWNSVQTLTQHPAVDWVVPLSLGDSHQGFRVLGTSADFFRHYRYGQNQTLQLAEGRVFDGVFDAVLGATVARQLGHALNDSLTVAHGAGPVSFVTHDDKPFRVSGILAPTGTPVDRSVIISLAGLEAIHADWVGGAPAPGRRLSAEAVLERDLTPRSVTAALVGLKSRVAVFQVQRLVNTWRAEPLQAIIPGVALQQLWQMMALSENALSLISAAVVLVALAVMLAALLTSLEARRRELAILRAIGARPWQIFALLLGESLLLSLIGATCGLLLLQGLASVAAPLLQARFGLGFSAWPPSPQEWTLLAAILLAGLLAGVWPAWQAYRHTLADGLSPRL